LAPVQERELLERARRGDRAAFAALVRPHLDSVRRFAFSFCGNWSDADDLAQDALVKAYRSIGSFEGRASLSTWLYTLSRSVFIDARRSRLGHEREREHELDDQREVDAGDSQEELVVQKDEVERLWRAVHALEPEFRIPVVLCDIEGMSYEQVATIEGVPIGTIRSRLSRARNKLAVALGGAEPDDSDRSRGTPGRPLSSNGTGRPAA
jgi:RNA polymerase sigma-70 factor (ECF subfamily)